MRKVIGLDLSIACTGVAGYGWADTIPTKGYVKKKRSDPIAEERRHLDHHHYRISQILSILFDQYMHGVDLVVMEGLSFDSYDTDRKNAGLAWIIRHRLHGLGIPYALVPASNLKQYAIGKGGGKDVDGNKIGKSHIIEAVFSWFPALGLLDDNAADALALAAMGADYLGQAWPEVTPGNRSALSKGFWPQLASDDIETLEMAA